MTLILKLDDITNTASVMKKEAAWLQKFQMTNPATAAAFPLVEFEVLDLESAVMQLGDIESRARTQSKRLRQDLERRGLDRHGLENALCNIQLLLEAETRFLDGVVADLVKKTNTSPGDYADQMLKWKAESDRLKKVFEQGLQDALALQTRIDAHNAEVRAFNRDLAFVKYLESRIDRMPASATGLFGKSIVQYRAQLIAQHDRLVKEQDLTDNGDRKRKLDAESAKLGKEGAAIEAAAKRATGQLEANNRLLMKLSGPNMDKLMFEMTRQKFNEDDRADVASALRELRLIHDAQAPSATKPAKPTDDAVKSALEALKKSWK